MDDILRKLSLDDPHFTHLDLRELDVSEEELPAIAHAVENNTIINRVSWKQGYLYDDTLKKQIEEKIVSNNRTFQRYPSDFVFALLSNHAYFDSTNGARVQFSSDTDVRDVEAWNRELESWTVWKVFDDPESSKYYGVAYSNKFKKQIVLSHRGTKFKWRDLLKGDSAVKTDLEGIVGGNKVEQQKKAYAATEEIVKHAKNIGYNLSFTGHSLGAWLSELSVYFAANDFDCKCKAVTFDSPGSASTMESFKSNVKSPGNKHITRNLNITTYLSDPNLINCCNPHVGKIFRIYPKIVKRKKILKLKSLMRKIPLGKHFELLITSILSVDSHNIELIIATFDSKTGKPKFLREVLDWPCFEYLTEVTVTKVVINFLSSLLPCFEVIPGVGWFIHEVFLKPTFVSCVKMLVDYVNGDISMYEFQEVCESSEFIAKRGEETVPLISEEKFTVRYEGHYSVRAFNPLKDFYNPDSTDFYLNKLHELSRNELNKMTICDDLKQFLNNLKAKYEIKFDIVKNKRCIRSKLSDIRIDALREEILRLCEIYSELKEVFDNKHTFLPHDEVPSSSGKIKSNLPLRSNKFLERPEVMKEIGEALEEHKFIVISAFGGTGKSTMAAEYGRDLQEKWNGQVVRIIDAANPGKICTNYRHIVEFDYGIDTKNHTENYLMQLVHSKISKAGPIVLFIFDNVEKYEDVNDYLNGISNLENVKAIITTRHVGLSENLQTIKLGPFSKDEAKSYIKNGTGNRFSPHDIDQLLNNLVGKSFYLPLNLSLFVEYVKLNPLYKIERFIEDVKKCNGETGELLLSNLVDRFKLSWLVLQYSAFLDPDFTNTVIFEKLLHADENELQVAIKELERSGLMSLRRLENGQCGLKVHRLIQDLVRKYLDINEGSERLISKPDIFESILEVLYSISLSEKHYIGHFQLFLKAGDVINQCLSWLRKFDSNSSNMPIFGEKIKSAIDIVSNSGPIVKHYRQNSDVIVPGGARVFRDPPSEGEDPSHHPSHWFENLQTFIHYAHCSFDVVNSKMMFINQEGLRNHVFRSYPSDFVLGLFSGDVNTDYQMNAIVEFPTISGVPDTEEWTEDLNGWTVFEIFNYSESWLHSAAYLNEYKEQMVFAHYCLPKKLLDFVKSGLRSDASDDATNDVSNDISDDASDDTSDASDDCLFDSVTTIVKDTVIKMFEEVALATERIIKHAEENGYTVSFTGHSFGTYFAILSLQISWFCCMNRDCKVATFNLPYIACRVEQSRSTSTDPEILRNVLSLSPTSQDKVFDFLLSLQFCCKNLHTWRPSLFCGVEFIPTKADEEWPTMISRNQYFWNPQLF